MKRVLLLLLVLASCMYVSCAPKAKPLPVLPIPKAIPVQPAVAAIRPSLDRAGDAAASLSESNGALALEAAAATKMAAEAAAKAKALAKQGAATAAELGMQANLNELLQSQTAELEAKAEKQDATISELRQAVSEARTAQADALAAAAQGDSAVNLLTQQAQSVTSQYQGAESARQSLAASVAVKDDHISRLSKALAGLGLICAVYVAARVIKTTPWGLPWLFWLP